MTCIPDVAKEETNDQMPTEIQDAATTVYSRQSVFVRPSLSNIRPKEKKKTYIAPLSNCARSHFFVGVICVHIKSSSFI